jgi:tripeptidyl-peptidase-1
MKLLAYKLTAAFAVAVAAAPSPAHVVHESRIHEPKNWVRKERLQSEAILPMRIGLKQSNLKNGHDLLLEVYGYLIREFWFYFTHAPQF